MNCLPAEVVVHLVQTHCPILARRVHFTFVDICLALEPFETGFTNTSILGGAVNTLSSILTRVCGALVYVDLTLGSGESIKAVAEKATGMFVQEHL